MTQVSPNVYCGHCGEARDVPGHERCAAAGLLDPPRFCGACRRRMVVQVTPTGWTARCSRHGEVTSRHGEVRGADW